MQTVRYNNRPCDQDFSPLQSHPFCGGSGWGDEEASVVCRSETNSKYGIGGEPMSPFIVGTRAKELAPTMQLFLLLWL